MGHGSLVPPPSVSLSELCVVGEDGLAGCCDFSSIWARTGWAVGDVRLGFGFRGGELAVSMRTRVMRQMDSRVISCELEQQKDGSVLLAG